MDLSILLIVALGIIVIIVAVAFAVYKAGFRTTKVKVKTGLMEAEMERSPTGDSKDTPAEAAPGTKAGQEATEGGVVRKSSIKAPADSGAELSQKAKGEGSRVDDSHIELN